MKRTASMAAAIFLATTLGAMAQSPSTTTASSSTTASDKITVSGCLQDGSGGSSTTASASTTASQSGSYVLMASAPPNADTAAGTSGSTTSSTTATGTTGTTSSAGSSMHNASYVLEGSSNELKNHVGHRVEVTGTLENNTDHGAASTATSTTTSGSASSRMSDGAKTLKVSSVRMIAADCSSK
ncbi:MAG: hypothetical protein JWL71_3185 [Acidobacteria bacterium]|nr:hypothetical protein [Acidobacteriota bacterium]